MHPHQRELTQLLADARVPESFARHFAPDVSAAAIESWRATLAAASPPTGFELVEQAHCNRMTWGEWVIDHSYYVFFDDERKVSSIEYESGFGPAMGRLVVSEHGGEATPTSLHDRCLAMK